MYELNENYDTYVDNEARSRQSATSPFTFLFRFPTHVEEEKEREKSDDDYPRDHHPHDDTCAMRNKYDNRNHFFTRTSTNVPSFYSLLGIYPLEICMDNTNNGCFCRSLSLSHKPTHSIEQKNEDKRDTERLVEDSPSFSLTNIRLLGSVRHNCTQRVRGC